MSQVWEATDELTKLTYALKIFSYEGKYEQQARELFVQEFKLMAALDHPNLLKPIHLDIAAGSNSPYMVSILYRKGSAVSVINKTTEPIDELVIAHFLKDAASALHYLHTQYLLIVHQDIKPDNFLIDDNGKYLLTDFGISIRIRETRIMINEEQDQNTFIPGDTAYAAPEKFQGAVARPSQDIFSLGVTLFEILTGVLPFSDFGGSMISKFKSLPSLDPGFGYSSRLNLICQQCMHTDPKQRPTAEKLVNLAEFYIAHSYWPSMDGETSTQGILNQSLKKIVELLRYKGNQLLAQLGTIRENVVQLINLLLRSPKYIYSILILFVLTGAVYFIMKDTDPTEKIKAYFLEKKYDEVINTIDRIGLSDLAENDTALYNRIIPYYGLSVLSKGDTAKAITYLHKGLELKDKDCVYELGYSYYKRDNINIAIGIFLLGDSMNEPRSAAMLGKIYYEGIAKVPKDEKRAVDYYRKAAQQENTSAMLGLAIAYIYGYEGTPPDTSNAKLLLRRVIEIGDRPDAVKTAENILTSIQ